MKLQTGDFFKPTATVEYCKSLSREISSEDRAVLFHGVSIGAFGVGAVQLAAAEQTLNLSSVKGVIWDSIVIGTQQNMKDGIILSAPSYAR